MEQNNQIKHKNKGLIFIAVVLLTITIISSSIGLWAWAKYTSAHNSNATAQVAKWSFDLRLKEGKQNAVETSGPIDLASTQFNHVANDRIAPGTSGLFYVIVDTTGTEVDVLYNVDITLTNCPRNIKFYRGTDNTGEELSLGGVNSTSRSFSFSRYLHANGTNGNENDKYEEPIYWVWDYSGAIEGNATTYDQWDTADSNLGTTTMTITATGTEQLEPPGTTVADITVADYGKYVNIGTDLLEKNNTTEADWRVFYKDENGAWLILADYLPVDEESIGASTVSAVELDCWSPYTVASDYDRVDLISKLDGNWSSLIAESDVAGKTGVVVKGAIDLDTWKNSWNESYPNDTIYTAQTASEMDDGVYGYYVGLSANPDEFNNLDLSSKTGANNNLYFSPVLSLEYYTIYGYWLSSPTADYNAPFPYCVSGAGLGGSSPDCEYSDYGVRPVVYLPNNISLDTTETVWTIAE